MTREHAQWLADQYQQLVGEVGKEEAERRIYALGIQCGKTNMVQYLFTGEVPEEWTEPAISTVIPINWYDSGDWEFFESQERSPDEDAEPIEIPKDLLDAYAQAKELVGDISAMIACAITDYVDKHPDTKLHWNVKNIVASVRNRRRQQEQKRRREEE